MADYSKQWVEMNDHKMGWDFDIEAIAADMKPGTINPYYICEGLGCVAIGKDDNGVIHLAISTGVFGDEGHEVHWKTLEEVLHG
jgi:hypothetical protein